MLQKIKNWFNDAKNNDEYFYKNFFIKVILIIIIILVIAFIFTKIKVNSGENEDGDKSFYNNLNKMKTAALNYFDENNIPKEINESKKISLNKLIKNNKLKTLTDSNSNICDGNNSYIKITKKQDNYQIKINLTCAEDNDYIIKNISVVDNGEE